MRKKTVPERTADTAEVVRNPKEGWMTTRSERRDYGLYLLGQNIIYALVANYLATYLPMRGISAGKSATVMLIVKTWDAVNDMLFGGIFDKVKFKKGKFVPWLRISLPFIPLATIMMFSIPNFAVDGWSSEQSITAKLLWFAVAYILWDTAYTLCDVPIYGMITTMTNNLQERTAIMSYSKLYTAVGTGIAMLLGTILVGQQIGMSYQGVSIIGAVLAFATMAFISFRGKERNYTAEDKEQQFSFREMFRYLGKNKYLLIFYLGFFLKEGLFTSNPLKMYASYYLFGHEMFALVVDVVSAIPMIGMPLLMPHLIKRVDKFKIYFWCVVLSAVTGFIIYFCGYQNVLLFVVLSIIRAIPLGIVGFLLFMFTPDCAEYGKYKTGTDAKGITFAIQTFSAKITSSVSSSLGLALIGWLGFKAYEAESFADLAAMGATQTPQAMGGLWIAYALVPAIGCALAAVVLYFYKLNDKDVQIMADCNTGLISREDAEQALSRKY